MGRLDSFASAGPAPPVSSDDPIPELSFVIPAYNEVENIAETLQLISIGVLGEYLARVFSEVKGRPGFLIAEDIRLDATHD